MTIRDDARGTIAAAIAARHDLHTPAESTYTTKYSVMLNGRTVSTHDDFAEARQAWVHASWMHTRDVAPHPSGGITVRTWREDGIMVRDGWLLHVQENGHVYLNSQLTLA